MWKIQAASAVRLRGLSMIVRIFIGVGLFALGYLVGKEMGRAESIRDQLSWATDDDDLMPDKHGPKEAVEPKQAG
jgi:hypothetical protein